MTKKETEILKDLTNAIYNLVDELEVLNNHKGKNGNTIADSLEDLSMAAYGIYNEINKM
tara:strand:+ start:301 stop:477 length:177 start_codon:yes stop_codon:yes gene_type:complete